MFADMMIEEYQQKKAARAQQIADMLKGPPTDEELGIIRFDAEAERRRLGLLDNNEFKHLHYIPQRYVAPNGLPPIRRFCSKYGDLFMYLCGLMLLAIALVVMGFWLWHLAEYQNSYSGKCQLSRSAETTGDGCRDCAFDIKGLINLNDQSDVVAKEKREAHLNHITASYDTSQMAEFYTAVARFTPQTLGEHYREFRVHKFPVRYNPYGIYFIPQKDVFRCCPHSCCQWLNPISTMDRGHCDTTVFHDLQDQQWRWWAHDTSTDDCNVGAWDCTLLAPADFDVELGAPIRDAIQNGVPHDSLLWEYSAKLAFETMSQAFFSMIAVWVGYCLGCLLIWTLERKTVAIRSMMADRIEATVQKLKIVSFEAHPKWGWKFFYHWGWWLWSQLDWYNDLYLRRLYYRVSRVPRRFYYGVQAQGEQEERYFKADARDCRRGPPPIYADMLLARDDFWTCCGWYCPCITFTIDVCREIYRKAKEEWNRVVIEGPPTESGTRSASRTSSVGQPVEVSLYEMGLQAARKRFLKPKVVNYHKKGNLPDYGDFGLEERSRAFKANLSAEQNTMTRGSRPMSAPPVYGNSRGGISNDLIARTAAQIAGNAAAMPPKGLLLLHRFNLNKRIARTPGVEGSFGAGTGVGEIPEPPKLPFSSGGGGADGGSGNTPNLAGIPGRATREDLANLNQAAKKLYRSTVGVAGGGGEDAKSDAGSGAGVDAVFQGGAPPANTGAIPGAKNQVHLPGFHGVKIAPLNPQVQEVPEEVKEEFRKAGGIINQKLTGAHEKFATRIRRYYKPGDKFDRLVIRVVKGETIDLTLHKHKHWKNPNHMVEVAEGTYAYRDDDPRGGRNAAGKPRSSSVSDEQSNNSGPGGSRRGKQVQDLNTAASSCGRNKKKEVTLEPIKHPRVLNVRGSLKDLFHIRPNCDALARVNNLVIDMENWHRADFERPCELEFVRLAPEWLVENPKRKYHTMRKARTQLRHRSADEIMDAVGKTIWGGKNVKSGSTVNHQLKNELERDIDFGEYLRNPVEQVDFYPLDARYDFANHISSAGAKERGDPHGRIKFKDPKQEARDKRKARREAFGGGGRGGKEVEVEVKVKITKTEILE